MCCIVDKIYTKEELTRLKKTQLTIKAYKVLRKTGHSAHEGFSYKQGLNVMNRPVRKYNENNPRGFHFFLTLKDAKAECRPWSNRVIVPVEIPVNDIVCLSHPTHHYRQGVSNSLFISEDAWKKAKLPV